MQERLMITPRGYATKNADINGDAKDGEKTGRSLSMGIKGWKACPRQYLRDAETTPSLQAVSQHFDMPMGEVLSGIGDAEGDDHATAFSATRQGTNTDALLADVEPWGEVRAVIRSEAGP